MPEFTCFYLGQGTPSFSLRSEMKRNGSEIFFAFFACFASMQNVEIWSETKMERSENKTKKKQKLPSFSLWSWMKQNGSEIFFSSMQKSVFRLFSHLKRNENEIKQKQNEKEAKTSKWKRIKWNSWTICKETKKNIKAGLVDTCLHP